MTQTALTARPEWIDALPANIRGRVAIHEAPAHLSQSGPCVLFTGRRNRNGYGRVWFRGREPVAHRLAYLLVRGVIPDGLLLDHLCRRRGCVNPYHTEPVTPAVNVRRGDAVLFKREGRSGDGNILRAH